MKTINEIKPDSYRNSFQKSTRPKPVEILKGRILRSILAITAALCANSAAAQTTWMTVDDIDPPSARAKGISADSAGNIFVVGSVPDTSGIAHAIVMKSSDQGINWVTADDVTAENSPTFGAVASKNILAFGEDHLVTAGWAERVYYPDTGTWSGRWLIRRSLDAGTTWTTLDHSYSYPRGVLSSPTGVALDASGNIYVVGWSEEKIVTGTGKKATTSYAFHWLIRQSRVNPNTGNLEWATTDIPFPVSSGGCYPHGVVCIGTETFVVGGNGAYWQVRKSSDGGTTWPVVDTFRFDASGSSRALGIAADSGGNLFVVGYGARVSQNTSKPSWIVRKGTGAGTSWTTVDQFQYPNGNAQAFGVTVDGNDTVHVTGTGWSGSSSSLRRWVTRQRSSLTGSWSTTDDFAYAPNGYSQGIKIVADPFRNLFAVGAGTDSSGVARNWLVRRKLAP